MLIDLSQTVNSATPVYPGDPAVSVEPAGVLAKDGFCDHKVTFGTHVGTHIDAPAHMIESGKQLKDYPAERFVLKAYCVDARHGFNVDNIDETVEAILFHSGADAYFHEERYWLDYPVLDDRAIQKLIARKTKLVGLDTGSADNADGFPVHKALLGADILIIENLTNLEQLIGKSFELLALPLKLENDGAPVRAVAKLLS